MLIVVRCIVASSDEAVNSLVLGFHILILTVTNNLSLNSSKQTKYSCIQEPLTIQLASAHRKRTKFVFVCVLIPFQKTVTKSHFVSGVKFTESRVVVAMDAHKL